MSISKKAVKLVLEYEESEGRNPVDVSSGQHIGYDILSVDSDGEDHRTIEVKGGSSGGIPDAFETEFTRKLKFVATHLYFVLFGDEEKKGKIHIIPKKEIDKYSDQHREVSHIKFASGLQNSIDDFLEAEREIER